MTMQALRDRVSKLVEGNWREKAELLLSERKESGKGQVSAFHSSEYFFLIVSSYLSYNNNNNTTDF